MDDSYYAHYKEIGFMCGLEVHQRLATSMKLFCHCPTNIIEMNDGTSQSVLRYQRAVAGEMGTVDVSAGFEEQRGRAFMYKLYKKHSCLVELDEEPPHMMNADALQIALSFASAMKMRVVDEIQPMRKAVVDGSDPSAFQRTALVGLSGFIKVNGEMVGMPTMFLEEESCSIEPSTGSAITYGLERMGVPLVEIDTWPLIRSPKDAKDIALYIGTMMRISGMVQRGIGSIRQDVNVSIRGGARVEIKGLQELGLMDQFIDNEVKRQQELLAIRDELRQRQASVGDAKSLTALFKGTRARIISNHVSDGGVVIGFRLKRFKGVLGREIQLKRRLGTEVSDYAKAAGVKGIIHSDENLRDYGFSQDEIEGISKRLSLGDEDSFVLIAGDKKSAYQAAIFAAMRARMALDGVPPETRGTINDGSCTTRFLRPLPGGSRMYPETDARPITVTKKMIDAANSVAPRVEAQESELVMQLKDANLARQLMLSQELQTYKAIVHKVREPIFIANILVQKMTELRRSGLDVDSISDDRLIELFELYGKKKITKQAVEEAIKHLAKRDRPVKEIIEEKRLQRISGSELMRLIDEQKGDHQDKHALAKALMAKYRLNVDGSELNAMLQDITDGATKTAPRAE